MPTVFITNKSGHDHSDAERFGTLKFVTSGRIDRFNVNEMYRQSIDALEGSVESDYIMITSLTILCSVLCSVFARKHGCLNLLLFKDGTYIERRIIIDQLLEGDDK